ncbi:hypothetical protein AKO1_002231 [Acrasis kona]|uniref:Uncharacterized protein n=1 Tax=Acrasis kona TaxID=1008807 RepID=A0AAW2ZCU5_9EUKA
MFRRPPFFAGGEDNSIELSDEEAVTRVKQFWNTFKREVVPHVMTIKKGLHKKSKYRRKISQYNVGDHVMWSIPELNDKSVPTFNAPANFLKKIELKQGEELLDEDKEEEEIELDEGIDYVRDEDYVPSDDSSDEDEIEEEEDQQRVPGVDIPEQITSTLVSSTPIRPRRLVKAQAPKQVIQVPVSTTPMQRRRKLVAKEPVSGRVL